MCSSLRSKNVFCRYECTPFINGNNGLQEGKLASSRKAQWHHCWPVHFSSHQQNVVFVEQLVNDQDKKPVNTTGPSGNWLLENPHSSYMLLSPLLSYMHVQSHTHSLLLTSHAFTHSFTDTTHDTGRITLFVKPTQSEWLRKIAWIRWIFVFVTLLVW